MLYLWSLIIMPCSRGGAEERGFLIIDTSGLWSLLTMTGRPKVYWCNFSRENTIANISFSIFFNLDVLFFSVSQGTACIGNCFSFLQQGSSTTLLACITLYLERCFGVIISKDWSCGHQCLHLFKRFILFSGLIPLNILSR